MEAYYDVFQQGQSKTILATSMVAIDLVWKGARGERALEVNKEAIERGTSVHRVFIFPSQAQLDAADAQEYLRRQSDAGVDVWYVLAVKLSIDLHRDFVVTNNDVAIEFRVDTDGNMVEGALSCVGHKAEEYRKIFRQIHSAAAKFMPVAPG